MNGHFGAWADRWLVLWGCKEAVDFAGVGAGGTIVLLGAGTAVAVAGRRRRCRQVPLVPDC